MQFIFVLFFFLLLTLRQTQLSLDHGHNPLMKKVFAVNLCFLQINQSETALKQVFTFLRTFIYKVRNISNYLLRDLGQVAQYGLLESGILQSFLPSGLDHIHRGINCLCFNLFFSHNNFFFCMLCVSSSQARFSRGVRICVHRSVMRS